MSNFSYTVQNQILQNVCLNGFACIYLNALFGNFGGHYINACLHGFACFAAKMGLFANLLSSFSFFADKNLWFSSQRRREGVVGVLMAALANIMGIVCLPFAPVFMCLAQNLYNWHVCLQTCGINY